MPRHYIYDSVITKIEKGKLITDTLWHKLPDFSLTNQLGEQVSWSEIEGKVVVADFFFTRCPTICARMTVNMKKLQDGITNTQRVGDKQPKFLHLISFSVDPERDSVLELKKWADRFQINSDRWWLLTGEKKEIYDLSIEHMKIGLVDGKGVGTSFFHSDKMVLIDKNRNIRGYYNGLDTMAIAKLSQDVILLALEKDPNKKKFYEGKLMLLLVIFLAAIAGFAGLILLLRKDRKKHELGT